jgi:kynureninase
MAPEFSPIPGAQGFQQSNPAALTVASLLGSLQTFKKAGMMDPLRERSKVLTGKLESLLHKSRYFVPPETASTRNDPGFTIITPPDPESRGTQLSLLFLPKGKEVMEKVYTGLKEWGVIGDDRKPDVIRLAPTPLYNTEEDVEAAARYLDVVLATVKNV